MKSRPKARRSSFWMSYAIKPHLEGAFNNRNIFSQFFQFLRVTVVLWGGNTADTINHCDLCHASSAPSNTLSQGPLSCGPLWLVLVSNKSYSMSQSIALRLCFWLLPVNCRISFSRKRFFRGDQIVVILSDKFWQRIKFKELVIYKSSS